MRANSLTAEYVRSILDYDPETGVFTWRHRADVPAKWNGRWVGKEAGHVWTASRSGKQYRDIRIKGRHYRAHRLAWLIVTGEWPTDQIDHRDCDGLNNRFENLRAATIVENSRNQIRSRNNTSGFKGAIYCKREKLWRACICVNRVQYSLGYFGTPEEAHAAYCAAAEKYHGEFARTA